jgi:phosphatidylglycerophosphate synthase
MPNLSFYKRPLLRPLGILASTALLAYLVWFAGPRTLWQNLASLGGGFVLVVALAGASHLIRTWAWRLTLGKDQHKLTFGSLVGLRLGAEAAGQLGMLGQTFGDSVRISHLSRKIKMGHSLASVTLDRGLYLVTGIMVIVGGLLGALPMLSLSHVLRLYAGLFVCGSIAFLSLTMSVMRKRSPFLSQGARLIGRIPALKDWIERRFHLIQSMESALFDFHHNTPRLFWASFALNLAAHCLAVLEVCLILSLLGFRFGFGSAMTIEALTKLVNAMGSLNPGNIGTYETGNMLIGRIFGLTNASALALAMTRRLRALFWTAVGCICLLLLTRSKKFVEARSVDTKEAANQPGVPAGTSNRSSSDGLAFVVFLPAANGRLGSARVGALPIPLRAILGAQKLGAAQIIVVTESAQVIQELLRSGRVPSSVHWIRAPLDASFRERLQLVAKEVNRQRVVLVDGSAMYHPSLLRQAVEWNNQGKSLVLTTDDAYGGLYALQVETLRNFVSHPAAEVRDFGELHASLIATQPVDSESVSEELWQHVDSPEDLRVAAAKLDHWLIKPTDGMYARLNRRISIPISHLLIKLPISANMVSIFTLGVGIVSAAFFAIGGYWNTLLGAILCLFASILDGCDGEVARLKLLESDFGCWLETVCDYVFYLFLLTGIAIGQWRTSGSKSYLVWGGFLLFGAVASFIAVGWQRHRLAAGRPEQLLGIWHSQTERRTSNPVLYAGRHLEFIVRRCFFPYALVVFALLGFMNVAFILSMIGANLVWPVALYSTRVFAPTAAIGGREAAEV